MSAEPARAFMNIGEVLARLRADFPDVTISKIRFLESEGLVEPARAPSGYRRFVEADVERLRYILTLQRDRYLPLRVIKQRLVTGEEATGDRVAASGDGRAPAPPRALVAAAESGSDAAERPELTRDELVRRTGVTAEQLDEMEAYGLVRAAGHRYPPEAERVVRGVAALGEFGLSARHLRGVRAAAERDISLIEQVVAPELHCGRPGSADRAEETARELAGLLIGVHGALLGMGLHAKRER